MPFDEKKSVNRNGKVYYWNKEKKKIIEANLKEIEIQNCPTDVLSDLLSLIEGEKT
jgi:hypothetical protein